MSTPLLSVVGVSRHPLAKLQESSSPKSFSKGPSIKRSERARQAGGESIDFTVRNTSNLIKPSPVTKQLHNSTTCGPSSIPKRKSCETTVVSAATSSEPLFSASTAAQLQTITADMIASMERRQLALEECEQKENAITKRGVVATVKRQMAVSAKLERAQRQAERRLAAAINKPAF